MEERKTILLIDDETDFLEMLKIRLEANNFRVITSTSAKDGIQQAKDSAPELIIMDIMMPDLDGIAAVLQLKTIEETKNIPVIVCTAVKEEEDRIVAENLAVAAYFRKGSDIKILLGRIEKALQKL